MHRSNQLFDHLVVRPSAFCGREAKGRYQTHDYLTKAASCRPPIPTGRLKRNHDFLKEKTSRPQSLYCAHGACIRHETNGARHADLQKPQRHHNCEQAPTFRLASELSPRNALAGNSARDSARKGPSNFAEEPFSGRPLAAVLTIRATKTPKANNQCPLYP